MTVLPWRQIKRRTKASDARAGLVGADWAFAVVIMVALTSPSLGQGVPLAIPNNDATRRYGDLKWKGLEVDLAGPTDTVDGEAAGIRASLAAHGIGYIGVGLQSFAENILDTPTTTNGKQVYSGQRPTFLTQDFFVMTYDAGRLGLPGGQFAVGASGSHYTWQQGGPNKFGLFTLSYYQPLFDDRIDVKIGYLVNVFEFANYYIGGSLAAGVCGQAGNSLLQGGLSGGGITTPGAELTIHLSETVYTKAALIRPISPDGTIVETRQNPTSLQFRVPNTGVLAIDETGYRVPASATRHEIWVRGAVALNSSRSIDLSDNSRASSNNGFAYVLADAELTQIDPIGKPSRGIYVGGTLSAAPAEYNRFSGLIQGRLYTKGLADSRPSDTMSLVASFNEFSPVAYAAAIRGHQLAHRGSLAITSSYGAHLVPGVYLNVGATWVDHPTTVTYAKTTGSALESLVNLSLFF